MLVAQLFPEEVLLAVLHKVGSSKVRIAEDRTLVQIFNEASIASPDLFGSFSKHQFYPDSDGLSDALQALDLGGAIIRENAATGYFTVGPRTCGDYGAKKFNSLSLTDQEKITRLAERIFQAYDVSSPN